MGNDHTNDRSDSALKGNRHNTAETILADQNKNKEEVLGAAKGSINKRDLPDGNFNVLVTQASLTFLGRRLPGNTDGQ